MRVARRALGAGLLIGILVLVGCAGPPQEPGTPPVDEQSQTEHEPTEEQPAIDVPDHLPIDIAPGGAVDGVFEPAAGTMQDYWLVRVLYPEAAETEVVAFYDEQLDELGFLDQKVDDRPGTTRWTTTADSRIVQLTVESGNQYYPGSTVLEIGWNED